VLSLLLGRRGALLPPLPSTGQFAHLSRVAASLIVARVCEPIWNARRERLERPCRP
jgi:hypothetical protein